MDAFHTEQFDVSQPPAVIASFILDPDRVTDYFPGALSAGRFDEGDAIWVLSKTGTTMIERVSAEDETSHVTVRVTSTQHKDVPPDRVALRRAALMRFNEDWILEEDGAGTRITKTWSDLETFGFMRFMPARWLIKRNGRSGATVITEKWSV